MDAAYIPLTVAAVLDVYPGFRVISFAANHMGYEAGQYLTLVHPVSGDEVRRSYSILSSPLLSEPLSIGVKRVENGLFSRMLVDDLKKGDVLYTTGAGGLFRLPPNLSNKRLFFFAAGSGITPVRSLIQTALLADQSVDIVLVYSNSSPQRAAFMEEFSALGAQYPDRFFFHPLFSNNPRLDRARLHRDLTLSFLQQHGDASKEQLYYLCGPESYIRLCEYVLRESGAGDSAIRKEHFLVPTVRVHLKPPDRATRTVTILYNRQEHHITVTYPDTILQAAKKTGLLLPYSCAYGRCGNCTARCVAGKVWHSNNEVLTDTDLANGFILTCTGHPVEGDAVIRIL